jgi:hypothetical protein
MTHMTAVRISYVNVSKTHMRLKRDLPSYASLAPPAPWSRHQEAEFWDGVNRPGGGVLEQKPWEAVGMSRTSWYRHGKPAAKPWRMTQAHLARLHGVSVRSIQRARRIAREWPELEQLVEEGKLSLAGAEFLIRGVERFERSRPPKGRPE